MKLNFNSNVNAIKPYLSLFTMVFLVACKAVGPDYKRAETNLPPVFSEALPAQAASSDSLRQWWTHYQDSKLNELVALSLKNNINVQLAIARIEEADASMREVGASLLPQVNISADATRNKVTELGAFPTFASPIRNNYAINLNTSYEIDFWGKLKRAKESATANAVATRFAKETVELSLIGLVASNYLQMRGLDSQIAVTLENIISRDESLKLTQRRLAGGVASALEVAQAEVSVSNLQAQLAELNRLRTLSLHQLAILTGQLDLNLASSDLRQLPIPLSPPTGLPSSLLENRPDIRQAEQNLIAENAQIGLAKSALYPSISLTGVFGAESLALKNLLKSGARIWTLGLGLDLPIFDSGKRQAKVAQASARQKQALAQYQNAIQQAFLEVNDALSNRRLNAEREQALINSQTAAKKSLRIAENRYKSGYSAYLEVLDAQRVHNDASIAVIQAKQASFLSTVTLFKSLGSGWAEPATIEKDKSIN